MYFGPTARKCALSLHLFFTTIWLGAAVAMMLVALLRPAAPKTSSALAAYCLAVKLIDDYIIIGAAGGSLLSGMLLSWKTKWGFFVWFWISFKLIATVAMVTFGATCLGPWINQTAQVAQEQGLAALSTEEYQITLWRTKVWGCAQVALLVSIVIISVFKPWGKIPWKPR